MISQLYIDSLDIVGENGDTVKATLETVQQDFNENNLDIHEVEFMPAGGEALGILIDCGRLQTRNTQERRRYIKGGITAILRWTS